MAEEYKPLQPAILNIPFTQGDCFSSKQFVDSLVVYKHRISEIIRTLDNKKPDDKFEVVFQFNYFKNGVQAKLEEATDPDKLQAGKSHNKITVSCYCNGGNG